MMNLVALPEFLARKGWSEIWVVLVKQYSDSVSLLLCKTSIAWFATSAMNKTCGSKFENSGLKPTNLTDRKFQELSCLCAAYFTTDETLDDIVSIHFFLGHSNGFHTPLF
jgi:hypothetical protein